MLDRHDLTDAEWARLEPLLPDTTPQRGSRWADHRTVLNAVFWRTRCGVPWRDVPASFGSWKTIYNRHRRWSADGTWERVLEELRRDADSAEGSDWTVAVDMRWCAPISTPPAPGTDRRLMSTRRSWCRSS